MLAGAMDVELDKQGRIMLPEYLREFAAVKKNVVIAGLYSRLEIWDEEVWNKYKGQTRSESGRDCRKNVGVGSVKFIKLKL